MPFDFLCCVRTGVEDVVELDYSHQSLTDVPNEVFVYERTLESLLCQSNHISELPRQLFMCHGLKYLDLSDNELQAIPAAISSLVNLHYINLSRNTLTSIPDTMKALKYLRFLDLSVNPLEKLPEAITNLSAIQDLYLNDTYLEYLPGNFGRLSNLRILELRDNYLMILPKSLSRSTDLLRLDIGQNEFQLFPEVIGRFLKLRELWIDGNNLTVIPSSIKTLESLIHLEASNNLIDELAPEIAFCTQLVDLSLSSNSLTELPYNFGQLHNLTTLKLDNNRLYSLPDSIGQLNNLEELMLMCNFLNKLPSSIGLLRKLQYLNVDDNLLTTIPPEIGSCIKLSVLSLRANKLTKVPPEVGHLSSLKVLNLVRNALSFLPQSLLNCENLVAIWLSENQSKPLVPMHSEIDPNTYEQILTCFLFPQVPLNHIENKPENEKQENNIAPISSRHISFVDLKTTAKATEKPVQLKRAPTPYPKELRALAKHARNIQRDGTQDLPPPMQNAVHIKAAKITPTFQQRFATDNCKETESGHEEDNEYCNKNRDKLSVYDNLPNENEYDKPLDLSHEPDKTYKSINHSLYPEKNGKHLTESIEQNLDIRSREFRSTSNQDETFGSRQERENENRESSASQTLYSSNINNNYPQTNIQVPHGHLMVNSNRFQKKNLSPKEMFMSSSLNSSINENSFSSKNIIDNNTKFKPIYDNNDSEGHYRESVYDKNSYVSAKEQQMYNKQNYDTFTCHNNQTSMIPSSRMQTVSQVVSSSTMPNLTMYNIHPKVLDSNHYQASSHKHSQVNVNNYEMSLSSPTYVSNTSPELYSPTGHTSATNPYRMTNTPLVSDDGSYNHIHSPTSHNIYDYYDSLPVSSNSPSLNNHQSNISESTYIRGQPPPYHIAAPYTKHAHYFNGTGG